MKYRLYVYCRDKGVSRDAGLHAEGEYNSDQSALNDLRNKGSQLYRYYDTVSMTFVRVEADGTETKI